MHTRILPVMLMFVFVWPVTAQQTDSIRAVALESVTVTADSYERMVGRNSVSPVEVAGKDFLTGHFTGNLIQALEYIPGVRSMDIGAGFSKPMIRGMAFNRIVVTENGVKQEGQQWGSDHGLEIDAFNVERVTVRKGPSSLLYGSDAMGGVIEIAPSPPPAGNQVFGEVSLLGKSVNSSLGGSLMLGIKHGAWYTKVRYSEQRFGDYRVPTDTIVYLTRKMPVYGRKLKNTAGRERNVNLYTEYRRGKYHSTYAVSNTYQKVGFFPGAHGVPDAARVQDDGDSRNIEFPYSLVNHLKLTTRQQYTWHNLIGSWDLGYQHNHREEWSKFHTHYSTQQPPEHNPDEELDFALSTYSSSMKLRYIPSTTWEHTAGWDMQFQQNRIGGYSFLLPRYERFTTGFFGLSTWHPSPELTVSGGLRYDWGSVDISASADPYLETYLHDMGYSEDQIAQYTWRSYAVKRNFGDLSGSVGMVWSPEGAHRVKANAGHSFRLPGANELASNGVHHGTFQHEQGDASLSSERGWQLDASYEYEVKGFSLSATTFFSWFNNYIYLRPSGTWSALPHSGMIYRYTGAEALFAGAELAFQVDFLRRFNYAFTGEYVYSQNLDERIPLSFSPPASMHNTLTWKNGKLRVFAELHSVAPQTRVDRNEAVTGGVNLVNLGSKLTLPIGTLDVDFTLSLRNVLDTRYYNHLSFYRKVEIPEPGRNIQILIHIPFKYNIK